MPSSASDLGLPPFDDELTLRSLSKGEAQHKSRPAPRAKAIGKVAASQASKVAAIVSPASQPKTATKAAGVSKPLVAAKAKPNPSAGKAKPDALSKLAAAEGSAPDSQGESKPGDGEDRASQRQFTMLAGWPVSMVLHAIGLVLLGLFMIAKPEKPVAMGIVSGTSEQDQLEDFAEIKIEQEQMPNNSTDFSADDSALDFQSISTENTAASQEVSSEGPEEISIGDNFGMTSKGDLMKEISGDGNKGATFFGVKSTGRKFVFVVDNSNSMGAGRFETAVQEVYEAVDRLKPNQVFYVIFYSDTAYSLFHPQAAPTFVAATQENKYKLQSWLAKVPMCLQTKGEEAMARAFAMNPDVIYLLGDGAFTDKADEQTLQKKGARVTIHTLGFGMKPQDRTQFESIAKAFSGKFTDVTVPKAMAELDKKNKRPRNKTRDGVWGLKLPVK